MWADNETAEDLLGFTIHADLVKSIVRDPEMLPVTVGLFGDWGGGKSSILKLIERDLAQPDVDTPETVVIYFDSWVFQGYEDAKTALLTVLIDELRNRRGLKDLIFEEATRLLKRVKWQKVARVGSAAAISYFSGNPAPVAVAAANATPAKGDEEAHEDGGWVRDPSESVSDVRSFRRDFAEMLKKTKLKSVIVLIDDLDRCSPERVIENLEAIKLFLNVKGMAFVIAADRRIVENAIRIRYADALSSAEGDAEARQTLVTDYLEKLVQVPYTLPKLAPHEVRSYLALLLLKKKLPSTRYQELLETYSRFLRANRYEPFDVAANLKLGEGDPIVKEVDKVLLLVGTCSDPITDALKGNPRQIKRFLNTLWMRERLAEVAKLELNQSVLIKLMVLEYLDGKRLKDVYEWHRQSSDGIAVPLTALEAADNGSDLGSYKSWDQPQFRRWLQSQPALAETDLRDYFWLSRSALDHTFAGVQMVSQAARRCMIQMLSGDIRGRQASVELFKQLDERDRSQVISGVARIGRNEPEKPEAVNALFELAQAGELIAADALVRVLEQADPKRLNVRIVSGLAKLKGGQGKESIDRIVGALPALVKRGGIFGKALERAMR